MNVVAGFYAPGDSVLHRLPAGAKLAGLALVGIASVWWSSPLGIGVILAVVLLGYAVARLRPRLLLRSLRSLLWVMVPLALFQAVVSGWRAAWLVVGSLVALILLANLVTFTTRSSDMIDVVAALCRPLARFRVDPHIVGLAMSLGIRAVPVVLGLATDIRDAQRARGLTARPTAFAIPLVLAALRHADDLSDALVARGLDD